MKTKANSELRPMDGANRGGVAYWHNLSAQESAGLLQTSVDEGLANAEATRRLQERGPNRIRIEKPEPLWKEFLGELKEPLVMLLLFTGVIYVVWGELTEALVIIGVILTLNTIEVLNERRAKKAIRSLRKLAELTVQVRRDGCWQELSAEQMAAGELIRLEAGRRVPADVRLVRSYGLACDESSLTGESALVEKGAELVLPRETPLAERRNMAFSGSLVKRGSGTRSTETPQW